MMSTFNVQRITLILTSLLSERDAQIGLLNKMSWSSYRCHFPVIQLCWVCMINDTHTYICVCVVAVLVGVAASLISTVITVATRQSCSIARFDPVAKGAHAWIIAITMKV